MMLTDYIRYWCSLAWRAGSLALDKVMSVLHWLWSPPPHHHHITRNETNSTRSKRCSSIIS